jgi:hypothetical protein
MFTLEALQELDVTVCRVAVVCQQSVINRPAEWDSSQTKNCRCQGKGVQVQKL